MPHGLKRFHESRQSHFVTFSCFRRQPNFNSPEIYDLFVRCLERMRRRFEMCVYGYVVMPEHVHLLISEPRRSTERLVGVRSLDSDLDSTVPQVGRVLDSNPGSAVPQVRGRSLAANLGSLADALHYLKLSFTKQLHGKTGFAGSFWQKRYYDRNVRDEREFVEKLRYLHRNPVKRGLVKDAADWKWSSFRHYAVQEVGPVEIESQWTARDRKRKAGSGLKRAFLIPSLP